MILADALSAPLPALDADAVALRQWASQLAPAQLDIIAHFFTPAAREAAKIARRDALVVSMIAGRQGSSLAVARQVHADLARYATTRWRYERDLTAPSDPRHRLAHEILHLSGGKVISVRRLRNILSGKKLATKTSANGQPTVS